MAHRVVGGAAHGAFRLARIFSRPKGKKRTRGAAPNEDDFMARIFVPIPIEGQEEA